MRKRIKRGMALLAALLLVLTTAPAPVYGAVVVAGNQTGDIGKESWISRKEFYGSFSSFGTIHAGSLSHLSVRGSDDKCITAFCLDAGKRFSSGKTIRCSGSVASQYPVIAEELNGLVAFYLHNQIFPEDLRRLVTQLAVWYVRKFPSSYDFFSAAFQQDIRTVLSHPDFTPNNDRVIRWYQQLYQLTGSAQCTVEEAWEGILRKIAEELTKSVKNLSGTVTTAVWSTGDSSMQNLLVTGSVTPWAAKGTLKVLKKDENGQGLSGAVFTLYNKEGKALARKLGPTDATGFAQLTDLDAGVYTVVETSFPQGYGPGSAVSWTVTIDFETTVWVGGAQGVVNAPLTGRIGVRKEDAEGNPLSGVKFGIFEDAGCLKKLLEMTTGADGSASSGELRGGRTYYVRELQTKSPQYVLDPKVYLAPVTADEITWVNQGEPLVNEKKYWQLTVSKKDSVTEGPGTGDARVTGAVYGLYDGTDRLLAQYTTDADGCFTTDAWPADTGYYLQELCAPEGYRTDPARYSLDALTAPALLEKTLTQVSLELKEEVKTGRLSLTKFLESEGENKKPEEGAIFEIYLKSAGSIEAAQESGDNRLWDRGTTNAAGIVIWSGGEAVTGELAYGRYILHQTAGTRGYHLSEDLEVEISRDGETQPFILENKLFRTTLTLHKRDAETGGMILRDEAVFRIRNLDTGILVSYHAVYPEEKDITEFTLTQGSLTLPVSLSTGRYAIEEIQPPRGYRQPEETVTLVVDENTPDQLVLDLWNDPVKGQIEIIKTAPVFSGVEETESPYGLVRRPVFSEEGLAGCRFIILAAEDIEDGSGGLRLRAGEVAAEVSTGADGRALSGGLYPGRYWVREVSAPSGYRISEEDLPAVISEETEQEPCRVRVHNSRMEAEVILYKEAERLIQREEGDNLSLLREKTPGEGFAFGLYAGRTYGSETGEGLEEDDLTALIVTDADGRGFFRGQLPFGSYYVKELASPEDRYQLLTESFPVDLEPEAAEDGVIQGQVNDGEPLFNSLSLFPVGIQKRERGTEAPLAGAVLEILGEAGEVLCRGITDTDGGLPGVELEPGQYRVRERTAPVGYAVNREVLAFTLLPDGTVEGETVLYNEKTRLVLYKVNPEQEPLSGAEFALCDEQGERVQTAAVDENGMAVFEGFGPGIYRILETQTPEGYQNPGVIGTVTVAADWENRADYASLTVVNYETVNTGDREAPLFWGAGAAGSLTVLLCLQGSRKKRAIKNPGR